MLIPNKFNGYQADGSRQYHKGGDGGAKQMRQQEEARQQRIAQATNSINAIFDSRPTKVMTGQVQSYDPNQTYYDAQGNVWKAPTKQTMRNVQRSLDEGGAGWEMETGLDQDAINAALKNGLYTGFNTVTPTKTRDQLYAEQKQAVYDLNKRDVEKQFKEAERQNRFGLARSGLMGGSVDVDSNAELMERNNEGLMRAQGLADNAAAELKTADERARQSLISMAQSGIDTGTAQQMAMKQLDASAQAAAGARAGATIGNLFGDMSQAYLMRQMAQGNAAGRNLAGQWYGVSDPRTGDAGKVG